MSEIHLQQMNLEDVKSYKLMEEYNAGFFEPGWGIGDYISSAIDHYGWECIPIWGIKGSKKSNRMLSYLYGVYGDWEKVHKHTVVEPMDYAALIAEKGRIPAVGWDDISAYLDSQLYFEDRPLYTKIKRSWALTRTKMNVFLCTSPLKTDIPAFILRDMTSEIFCSPKRGNDDQGMTTYDRWAWSKDDYDPMKVRKRSINVHRWMIFDIYEVPKEEFQRYWARRLKLAEYGSKMVVEAFKEAFNHADIPEAPTEPEVREAAQILSRARPRKHGF